MLVRLFKDDVPTRVSLFKGQSGNKMLDGLNTERYTIVFQKILRSRLRELVLLVPLLVTAETVCYWSSWGSSLSRM